MRYDGLAERLRPYNVNVALLPIGGKNFSASDAAQLAEDIGAGWLGPMHYEPGEENDFVTHMLGHRPLQQFKLFQVSERWTVPEE